MNQESECNIEPQKPKLWVAQFANKKKETGCMIMSAATIREAKGLIRNDNSFFSKEHLIEMHPIPENITSPTVLCEIKNCLEHY